MENFSQMMSPIKSKFIHSNDQIQNLFTDFKTPIKNIEKHIFFKDEKSLDSFSVLTPRKTNYIDKSAIEMGLLW